jgi:hypothetical protein
LILILAPAPDISEHIEQSQVIRLFAPDRPGSGPSPPNFAAPRGAIGASAVACGSKNGGSGVMPMLSRRPKKAKV